MPKPEASPAALELYEALEPAFTDGDEGRGWPSLKICMALVAGDVDRLHFYVTEQDDGTPGWGVIFDPDLCPPEALPFLANFDGAILRPDMSVAQERAAIKFPQAFSRGTLEAIEEVAKRRLTGTKSVIVTERYTGSPWRVRIETIEAETPEPAKTEQEIREEQKPIGIVLFFNTRVPWTWLELRTEVATNTWKKVREVFPTWFAVRTHEP